MNGFYPEGWLNGNADEKKGVYAAPALNEAMLKQTVLEAPVMLCDASHNLILDLGAYKGVIPREEGAIGIADGSTRDIALISRVGKSVCFCIKELRTDSAGRPYAVCSRKQAQELCRQAILSQKRAGDILDARITHLESFGAFCDIGCGNIALLPIDAVSVSRISHPRDRFGVGDAVRVLIKSIAEDGKITLSHKELLGTWEENAAMFSAGQTVTGVIRSVEDYGVFVELTPNLAGLAEPKPDAFIGRQASVYIKSMIREKMKIKLIIIDSFDSDYVPPIRYFYGGNRMEEWEYSPAECRKRISPRFCG